MNRKISANYVFTMAGPPLKNGIVEVSHDGNIVSVCDTGGEITESEQLEHYPGILVPGFVNAHTHLELSLLKTYQNQGMGLTSFLTGIRSSRIQDEELILHTIQKNDARMFAGGVQAAGDICNTGNTILTKIGSKIKYFNFCEVYGAEIADADTRFQQIQNLCRQFLQNNLMAGISPHAPYSVSLPLLEKICQVPSEMLSIHNQESREENALFQNGISQIKESFENLGVSYENWPVTGKTSLQTWLPYLKNASKIILVHNIYTSQEDLDFLSAFEKTNSGKVYFAFCPVSNLTIENQLPDFELFKSYADKICLGTDSRASNARCDMLEDMKAIQNNSNFSIHEILRFATINGAKALGFEKKIGSIEVGKKPGLLLLNNFDFQRWRLLNDSRVKRLI